MGQSGRKKKRYVAGKNYRKKKAALEGSSKKQTKKGVGKPDFKCRGFCQEKVIETKGWMRSQTLKISCGKKGAW